MSNFMFHMPSLPLRDMPPSVKGYAFANEDDGRGSGIGTRVFEDDKTRRSSTSLPHSTEGAHAFI